VGRFRELEDVAIADCALEIEAADLPELFRTAAQALAAVTVDPTTLAGTATRTIRVSADALDLLLFDLLSELIFVRDTEGIVLADGAVTVEGGPPWRLRAELTGGTIDPGRTERRADPKAVTFHQLAVARTGAGWRARVVVDV
jgi:SHS2 domain-containing protein